MFVQTMYNIVDTAFVGRLGAEAIAALSFSFPVFFILVALTQGIGTGLNSTISRFYGAGRKGDAENAAIHGLLLSLVFAVLTFLAGLLGWLNIAPMSSMSAVAAATAALPAPASLGRLAGLFKVFADPSRLRILSALAVSNTHLYAGMSDDAAFRQTIRRWLDWARARPDIMRAQAIFLPDWPGGGVCDGYLRLAHGRGYAFLFNANQTAASNFRYFEALTAAGIYYLLLTTIFMVGQAWLERALDPKRRREAKVRKPLIERFIPSAEAR
jgi:hypothetical protein